MGAEYIHHASCLNNWLSMCLSALFKNMSA